MDTAKLSARRLAGVRLWLWSVAALIFAMVIVGGATRLTESGLSIVEWKPVTGTIPPITSEQWSEAFDAYKTIPQYRELNRGMTLEQFKTIFWWEWGHRLLGRIIGAAFLFPFLWFMWRGELPAALRQRLWIIFGLGALQGAVGWWMVASGLADRLEVSQYRLATHLVLAVVIFMAIIWTAERLVERPLETPSRASRIEAALLVLLTLFQIYLGALVAGLRAGLVYNTWPTIDGTLIPPAARLWFETPWWHNLFENTLTVQFDHRMVAYGLVLFAIWHIGRIVRDMPGSAAVRRSLWLLIAVGVQVVFGILTLIWVVPLNLALLHQGMALVVMTLAVMHAERLYRKAA
jgi:cytochrome c oxidase assembly protein subunit 15